MESEALLLNVDSAEDILLKEKDRSDSNSSSSQGVTEQTGFKANSLDPLVKSQRDAADSKGHTGRLEMSHRRLSSQGQVRPYDPIGRLHGKRSVANFEKRRRSQMQSFLNRVKIRQNALLGQKEKDQRIEQLKSQIALDRSQERSSMSVSAAPLRYLLDSSKDQTANIAAADSINELELSKELLVHKKIPLLEKNNIYIQKAAMMNKKRENQKHFSQFVGKSNAIVQASGSPYTKRDTRRDGASSNRDARSKSLLLNEASANDQKQTDNTKRYADYDWHSNEQILYHENSKSSMDPQTRIARDTQLKGINAFQDLVERHENAQNNTFNAGNESNFVRDMPSESSRDDDMHARKFSEASVQDNETRQIIVIKKKKHSKLEDTSYFSKILNKSEEEAALR